MHSVKKTNKHKMYHKKGVEEGKALPILWAPTMARNLLGKI